MISYYISVKRIMRMVYDTSRKENYNVLMMILLIICAKQSGMVKLMDGWKLIRNSTDLSHLFLRYLKSMLKQTKM